MPNVKNKPTDEQIWAEADKFYRLRQFEKAILEIDKLIENNPSATFYWGIKASILRQLNKPIDAVNIIDQGLAINSTDYTLLQQKAEIIFENATNFQQVDEAIQLIDQAEVNFDEVNYTAKLEEQIKDMPSFQNWIVSLVQGRTKLATAKQNMQLMRRIFELNNRVDNVDNKLDQDKVKQFETLALFSAVLALIITNVQVAPKLELRQLAVLNLGLIIAITLSFTLGSLSLSIGMKSARERKFWLTSILILLGIIYYLLLR